MSMYHKDGTRHPPVSKVPCQHPECQPSAATLTPELPVDLREAALNATHVVGGPDPWNNGRLHPRIVLALLDRIAELEEAAKATRTRINAALSTLAASDRVVLTVPEFESMIKRLEAGPR